MIPALTLLSGVVQLAPALSKLFGAGAKTAEVAEIAASVARQVTGLPDNQAALDALKTSPELLVQYQRTLIEQANTFEQLYIADKADARARDAAYLHAGKRNYRADFLVGVSVGIVAAIIGIVVIAQDLTDFTKGAITTILGMFLTQLANIYSFEFGTTRKIEDRNAQVTSKEN